MHHIPVWVFVGLLALKNNDILSNKYICDVPFSFFWGDTVNYLSLLRLCRVKRYSGVCIDMFVVKSRVLLNAKCVNLGSNVRFTRLTCMQLKEWITWEIIMFTESSVCVLMLLTEAFWLVQCVPFLVPNRDFLNSMLIVLEAPNRPGLYCLLCRINVIVVWTRKFHEYNFDHPGNGLMVLWMQVSLSFAKECLA